MWNLVTSIAQWPLWNFLTVVLIVWLTQRIIAWRERRKKIDDARLELYMSIMGSISDFHAAALNPPKGTSDVLELRRKGWEIAARLSILGAPGVMETFGDFMAYVMSRVAQQKSGEDAEVGQMASRVTYAICCDIHGEEFKSCRMSSEA